MSKKYLSQEGFTGKGTDLRMRRVHGKIYIDVRISNGEDEAYDYRQDRRVKK